jgi:simple sugar transport system permease protein
MVQLIQAIIVISVACSEFFIRHRIRRVASGGTSGVSNIAPGGTSNTP